MIFKDRLVAVFFVYNYLSLEGLLMKNNDLHAQVINLNDIKIAQNNKNINEGYADVIAFWVSSLLNVIYDTGDAQNKFNLKGSKEDISALVHLIGLEKRYINTAMSVGMDKPQTLKVKTMLDSAINSFETKTNIKWPFKN